MKELTDINTMSIELVELLTPMLVIMLALILTLMVRDFATKSGKPSTQGPKATGERYLPSAAIKSLSSAEYAATSRAKRKGTKAGKQYVKQPKKIAKKTRSYRK